jgi:hypothetical protein
MESGTRVMITLSHLVDLRMEEGMYMNGWKGERGERRGERGEGRVSAVRRAIRGIHEIIP